MSHHLGQTERLHIGEANDFPGIYVVLWRFVPHLGIYQILTTWVVLLKLLLKDFGIFGGYGLAILFKFYR